MTKREALERAEHHLNAAEKDIAAHSLDMANAYIALPEEPVLA